MVIRNPYGFIAKYFKIISFLLLIPMIYLTFTLGDVNTFFNDYIGQGYVTQENNFADSYVTGYMYGATLFLLAANVIIYFTLSSKKKSALYNLISIFYYLFVLFSLLLFKSAMAGIESESLDPTFANFVRDFSLITKVPMYLLLIINVLNIVGFNIKTLRFDNDRNLRLPEDDDSNIEIKIGNDDNSAKRTMVHTIRELKYYILENKFVFKCIAGALIILVVFVSYKNYQLYNKTYASNQAFRMDDFTLSLKESYITDVDYGGLKVSETKKYLVIKMGIENNSGPTVIDRTHFRIHAGDDVIYPSYDKATRFVDIGKPYIGGTIPAREAADYVFAYELKDNQIRSSYQMRILNGLAADGNKLEKKYKKITVKPKNILKKKELGKAKIGKQINFKDTMLGETKYTIKNAILSSSYPYTYEVCRNKKCETFHDTIVPSPGKAVLVLEDELKWDESTEYFKNSKKDFYNDFVRIDYVFKLMTGIETKNVHRSTKLKNITPQLISDKHIYEVPNTLVNAHKVEMIINVRNKELVIEIK